LNKEDAALSNKRVDEYVETISEFEKRCAVLEEKLTFYKM
jgi:hypothetical protein